MGFADKMKRSEYGALHQAKTALSRVDVIEPTKAHVFAG